MDHDGIPIQATARQVRPTTPRQVLPIFVRKNRLQYHDVGVRGGRNQSNRFTKRMLAYRNTLCEEERYTLLRSHAAKRRVQEMLLGFVERHGGRVMKQVPRSETHCYVVSRRKALSIMAAKLREGPDLTAIDDGSIQSYPTDDMDTDDDFNIKEIMF